MRNWIAYWGLTRNPFTEHDPAFVDVPHHAAVIGQIVTALESGERAVDLAAEAGTGKSRVLEQTIAVSSRPGRRWVRVSCPPDGPTLFSLLAERLGVSLGSSPTWSEAWRALTRAIRLRRSLAEHIVLAIDDCHALETPGLAHDLERLEQLDPRGGVTVVRVGRATDDSRSWESSWRHPLRLGPLSRTETERFLQRKLALAGRDAPTFTPESIGRLQSWSGGVPRGLNRLASLVLETTARRGRTLVEPSVVEEMAWNCLEGGPGS